MKLAYLFLGATALLLLCGCGSVLSTSSGDLRTFVGCAVREFTFLAKKPGCRGLRITTDACWGRCETWEVSGSACGRSGLNLKQCSPFQRLEVEPGHLPSPGDLETPNSIF